MTHIYEGNRDWQTALGGAAVVVDKRPLPPRHDLRNHSPTGFEWGCGGSGPAQLSLAILAHHLGNDQEALRLQHRFKYSVVAAIQEDQWRMTSQDIDIALAQIRGAIDD